MGVSHIFQIVQMVPNRTTHHSVTVPLKAKYKNKLKNMNCIYLKCIAL